ncbi:MAG: LCP family protein [Chloroflexota bacterium]
MQMQNPIPANYARSQPRHMSKARGCLAVLFVTTLLFMCSITAMIALYITFPPAPIDILVMGLDSRGNEGSVTRTDSIIVVGINPARLDVSLLSIPRDIFVNVPGYGLQRINTVNVLAEMNNPGSGRELLAQTIEANFGIGIDKTIRLDFQAFTALVDAVGGITVDVPSLVVDNNYPTADYGTMSIRFEPGVQQMNGDQALIYARTRHQDDDYRRAERQQRVISALTVKMLNPLNWGRAYVAIVQNTESDLSLLDMALMTPPVLFSAGDLNQLVVNRDYILPGDGYVVPNYEALRPYIQENFD